MSLIRVAAHPGTPGGRSRRPSMVQVLAGRSADWHHQLITVTHVLYLVVINNALSTDIACRAYGSLNASSWSLWHRDDGDSMQLLPGARGFFEFTTSPTIEQHEWLVGCAITTDTCYGRNSNESFRVTLELKMGGEFAGNGI